MFGSDFLHWRNSRREEDGVVLPGVLCANISFSHGTVSHSDHVLAPLFAEVTHAALCSQPRNRPHRHPDALFMSQSPHINRVITALLRLNKRRTKESFLNWNWEKEREAFDQTFGLNYRCDQKTTVGRLKTAGLEELYLMEKKKKKKHPEKLSLCRSHLSSLTRRNYLRKSLISQLKKCCVAFKW